ncbi:MAG: methionyl-tRNA formyltransferase [Candidatus Dadabacteria bacterium]|nr:methionyl-tRNA formyltransferase [Candidatus Dadabacteria bacterium]
MKIVFMGTPEFAVPSLSALIGAGYEVAAVVTQPDRPSGRGKVLTPPPVKTAAEAAGIPVLQPPKIRTEGFFAELSSYSPDLICVTAYGRILPKSILDLPSYGCVNAHASLLPKLRGAAPVNWAIVRGESVTGVTTMLMDEGMDTGDMLLRREVAIEDDDTGETLSRKLSIVGGELLAETLALLEEGGLRPEKQDESLATYAPIIRKEDGLIDWSKPARDIRNLVRGMLPWPGAYTFIGGKMLKVFRSAVSEGEGRPGEVIKSDGGVLRVAAGEGALDVLELQVEGGKRLGAAAFLAGRKIAGGAILGSA